VTCEILLFGLCWEKSGPALDLSIFGFGDLVSALALLVVIYTITGIRYRFRIAIAPGNLHKQTFYIIAAIGIVILLTEVWVRSGWLFPSSLISHSIWQAILGLVFLALVLSWVYYAFLKPPIFSKQNFDIYTQELYRIILRGSDSELPEIANELAYSAEALIDFAGLVERIPAGVSGEDSEIEPQPVIQSYANDLLLLIANRKFCRHVVASSPVTAIHLFEFASEKKKYNVPLGAFSQNIVTEAILNRDSLLYHEDDGFHSGLIGYLQPFSKATFGNFELVEGLGSGNRSPLDVNYSDVSEWDAGQVKVYCQCVRLTLEDYLEKGWWGRHSFALNRAFSHIQQATSDLYKLNEDVSDSHYDDAYFRLREVVRFIREVVKLIEEVGKAPKPFKLRLKESDHHVRDLYDQIAELIFEVILDASAVKGPPDRAWSIHHNAIWGDLFTFSSKGEAWKFVSFKLRRQIFDEISRMEKCPNYKGAKFLGYCLNVMGLHVREATSNDRGYVALQKAVISWAKKNFMSVHAELPDVANACLIGRISFDENNHRLVTTYAKGLRNEAPKDYLDLNA